MAEFSIVLEKGRRQAEGFDRCAALLGDCSDQITGISNSLCQLGGSTGNIKAALRKVSESVGVEQRRSRDLGEKLVNIITIYETTEKKICNDTENSRNGQIGQGTVSGTPGKDTGTEAGDAYGWDDILSDWWNGYKEELEWLMPDDLTDAVILGLIASSAAGIPALASLAMLPDGFKNYVWDALRQTVGGDFVDESNLLGITLSVVVGCVPVLGQIADVRDFVADIYNLIDEGPTVEEWVALGFTTVGLIPGIGDFLKHGDEAGDVVGDVVKTLSRNADKADEVADAVKNLLKKGDDVFSAVGGKIDQFNNFMKDNVADKIMNKVDELPAYHKMKDSIDSVKTAMTNNDVYKGIDNILDKLSFEDGDIDVSAKGIISGVADSYWGGFVDDQKQSVVARLIKNILGTSQEEPAPAQ